MTIRSGFFNSVNGDRKYDAKRFAEYFASFIGNGVFPNPSDNLQVMANDDMTVTVKPGKAWINGYILINDDDYILEIEPADGWLNRMDRIVARYDVVDREIRLEVKKGKFASGVVPPSLQRDADVYELALADVYVGNGIISMTQAIITDLRLNTELCGIVHGTVEQVDTTAIFNQFESWYEQTKSAYDADMATWTTEKKQAFDDWYETNTIAFMEQFNTWYETNTTEWANGFNEWFEAIKGQLDGDIAANLASQIVELQNEKANKTEFDALKSNFDEHKAEKVHQGEIHGFRLSDGKLEYFDGKEYVRVKGDGYPVGNVSNFNAKEDNQKITLTWQDPEDLTITDSNGNVITIAKWKGTKILRKTGSYPANENDGVLVVDNGVRNQYQTNGFVDTGLVNDTEYFYMAFPYTVEDVFTVDEKNRVSATPTEQRIYGIEIDESNSNPDTRVTYTDNAIGFTPASGNDGNFQWGSWENIIKEEFQIRPCVLQNKQVNYYLNHEDYTKKADGTTSKLDGTDGDVMVEFGIPIYYKWTTVGDVHKVQVSTKYFNGAVKYAHEVEDGYNQMPYYPLLLTQILFVLIFKSTNSQTALGRGRVDGAEYINTGNTDTKGFMYGSKSDEQMKFLGIEDYWGNEYYWIDGLVTDSSYNLLIGNSNFNNSGGGYTQFSSGKPSSVGGYIDKVQGGNDKGFIIKSSGGSETTHYCDSGYLGSGKVAYFGGDCSSGSRAGFAQLQLVHSASYAYSYFATRLFCKSNAKIYIGAYLGTEQNGKLRSISGAMPIDNKTIGSFRTLARANNN